MYIQKFQLIVPLNTNLLVHALAASEGEHEKLQVFHGTQAVKNYGITVQGSGVIAKGNINGSLMTYDFKALYDVYNLKQTESAKYWFIPYSKDTSHDELKETFESSKRLTTNYNVDFTIQGNDYGISSVFITFEVIRLVLNGETKDYVVTNPASTGANNADGSTYQGEFKPIEQAQPVPA
jgi:hypothetical protein